MGISKTVMDRFSLFVEEYKIKKKHKYLADTLEDILENKMVCFIDYGNVEKFISPLLKDKLFSEYSKRNMLKKEYENNNVELFKSGESDYDTDDN